jgi:hypothetical protein
VCSPLFDRTPISRDRDCCGLTEIVWRAGTSSLYSTGESPHIKAGHREFLPHLESTCTQFNTSARRRTRPSAGHEKSQQLQIPPSLNSKAILQRVRLLFLQRQHWRAPSYFCCANIGGRLVFLLRQPWRAPSFSLAPTLLWTPIFSYAPSFYHPPKILGVPMFFECANVFCTYFSALLFLYTFLHSYLVCTNNLNGANVLRLLG